MRSELATQLSCESCGCREALVVSVYIISVMEHIDDGTTTCLRRAGSTSKSGRLRFPCIMSTVVAIEQRNEEKLQDSLFVSIVTLMEGVAGLLLAIIALVVGTW